MPAYWLEIHHKGESKTHRFDADAVIIGRHKDADFVLDDRTVSRKHARIIRSSGGTFYLHVLSTSGLTAIDGKRVQGEVELRSGSSILLGEVKLVFKVEGAPRPAMGAPPARAVAPSTASTGASPIGFGPSAPLKKSVDSIGGAAASQWDKYADEREAEMSAVSEVEEDPTPSADEEEDNPLDRIREIETKKRSTINPLLIVATLVFAAIGLYFVFAPRALPQRPSTADGVMSEPGDPPVIRVKCLSKDDCIGKAVASYTNGLNDYKMRKVHVQNLYTSYKKMLEAEAYLADKGLTAPPELAELEKNKALARAELDEIFKGYKVTYVSRSKNGMYRDMVTALKGIRSYFPDVDAPEHRWAEDRAVELRADGNYYDF